SIPTARTPSFTDHDASAATTRKEGSRQPIMPDAPPKSARRTRPLWTCGRRFASPTSPQGEQNQKKRTFDALPKPDNFIRYRQIMSGGFPRPPQPDCEALKH